MCFTVILEVQPAVALDADNRANYLGMFDDGEDAHGLHILPMLCWHLCCLYLALPILLSASISDCMSHVMYSSILGSGHNVDTR